MLLKNKRKLTEAFVQHEGVECLIEGNVCYLDNDLVWDIYNITSYEGAAQFVCYNSNNSAAETFIQTAVNNFPTVLAGHELLFIVKHNTNEVACAILTNENSTINDHINCNFSIEWASLFSEIYGKNINNLNLVLPESSNINLKFSDIPNKSGLVINDKKCVDILAAFMNLDEGKVINFPEGVANLDDEAFMEFPNRCFNDFTFNFPQSIKRIGSFIENLETNLAGCKLNFQFTEKQAKEIFTDGIKDDIFKAAEDGILKLNFLDSYESDEDFKADILSDLEELQSNKSKSEEIENNLNEIISKCFKYLKTTTEEAFPDDIKNKITELRTSIDKKKHLEDVAKQNEFAFKIQGNEAWVIDYFGNEKNTLVIPETYKGKLVTRLEKYALNNPDILFLGNLVLPKGIKHIGRNCIGNVGSISLVGDPKNISCTSTSILELGIEKGNSGNTLWEVFKDGRRYLHKISQEEYNRLSEGGNS